MAQGGDLAAHVSACVLDDENTAVRRIAAGQDIGAAMQACIDSELEVLSDIARLSAADAAAGIRYGGYLPTWSNSEIDLAALYAQHLKDVATKGYGMWARYRMFTVRSDGRIAPVRVPDPIQLDDLKEYEYQRGRVRDNTLALIKGLPAANVLLYGDAGTGKSSTVKALVNAYHGDGLRLVEMGKHQCGMIPDVIETLRALPLKFILFFDDLSFAGENDAFYALKSALEGSASGGAPGVVIDAGAVRALAAVWADGRLSAPE
jgi:predicted AAA+ superfamily ATPase